MKRHRGYIQEVREATRADCWTFCKSSPGSESSPSRALLDAEAVPEFQKLFLNDDVAAASSKDSWLHFFGLLTLAKHFVWANEH